MKQPPEILYVRFGGRSPELIGRRIVREKSEIDSKESGETKKKTLIARENDVKPVPGGEAGDKRAKKQRGDPKDDTKREPRRTMSGLYTFREVSNLFDISVSRLRYWDRSGFLSPSGNHGARRRYTFQDLIGIRSVKTLLDKGVTIQKARGFVKSIRQKIPQSSHPLDRLRIMGDSKTVTVVDEDREFEAASGQLLLDFRVRDFEKEVVAKFPEIGLDKTERSAYEWYLEGCRLDENEATLALAEEAYHRAIHLDPTLANAYTNLGNLMYRSGYPEDAKTLYNKAIEVDTNQPEAHYNLGFIEFEHGNLESAETCFSVAVELDSMFADAHFNVAITLFRLGRLERARAHLQSYLEIEPTGPWADIARQRLSDMK